jgi:hypothetical protein
MTNEHRPRIAAEITPQQYRRLSLILPHGMQKPLFQAVVQGIIELYDKGGLPALGAIISNHISITQISLIGEGLSKRERIQALKEELRRLEDGHH